MKKMKRKSGQIRKHVYIAEPTRKESKPKELTSLIAHEAQKRGELVTLLSGCAVVVHFRDVLGYADFQKHIARIAGWNIYMSMTPVR